LRHILKAILVYKLEGSRNSYLYFYLLLSELLFF
jgi:hypothetical protein